MQVDFYQLSHDPVHRVIPAIAARILEQNERLLIVDSRTETLDRLSQALWEAQPASFLAHDRAGCAQPDLQPILLADRCDAANGAFHIALTDGLWRDEALAFVRAFYFFDDATVDQARTCWRILARNSDVEPRYWRQEGRRWVKGP